MADNERTIESIINGFKNVYECKHCGNKQNVNLLPYINFTKNPEYYQLVKTLSIYKVKCEKCGKEEFIKFDTLLVDDKHKYFIYFLTDRSKHNRFKYQITYFIETSLNKNHDYDLSDYNTRLVFEPNDIIEKMQIFELGLNDLAIEIIKQGLYEKGVFNRNVHDSIFFDGIEENNLIFIGFSSKSESVELKKIALDYEFYNKVIDDIKNLDARHKEYFEVIDQNWVLENFKDFSK